jgi:hypothetical protein
MKRLPLLLGTLFATALLAVLYALSIRGAAAQAGGPPDFTQFGFPQVVGSADFTPGMTATISAGRQQVILPSNFISKTVRFELLEGDTSTFTARLPVTDQGRTIIIAWAFRVTDPATNQLVARFDNPVQWSVTDPAITAGSAVYNTTAANPPVVTPNAAPGVITGTTLTHPFGGAGVGWLVLGPPAAQPTGTVEATGTALATSTALPTTAPTEIATVAPTEVPTELPTAAPPPEVLPTETVVPIGMPSTGGSPFGLETVFLLALAALVGVVAGVALRRKPLA